MAAKLVGFVAAHGDALEFLELAEEVLDEMAPLVDVVVDRERICALRMLGDDEPAPRSLRSAMMELLSKALSAISAKVDPLDQRLHAHRVVAMAGQQFEAHEIAKRVGERQDLGRHAASRVPDGLALSPLFAPCPWRWTLTMVASTMAYSMSGSSEQASNSRTKTSAFPSRGSD